MYSRSFTVWLTLCSLAAANPPGASYIFPAGGQRGTTVEVRVGGHFLHGECGFEMLGKGVQAGPRIKETKTVWFEGPVIPLPDSQRTEDYPRDHSGQITIAADAELGARHWRVWTSQGATPSRKFIIGDLPEIIEHEIDGDPLPTLVNLPITINGRMFPREDVDIWTVNLTAGQTVHCEVHAARLGSPLQSRLEVRDPSGMPIAENSGQFGADAFLSFTALAAGTYQIRIHDLEFGGLQDYVYRLSLTTGPRIEAVYPLGGRRGSELSLEIRSSTNAPRAEVDGTRSMPATMRVTLPNDGTADFSTLLKVGELWTNPVLLELDDLPEHLEPVPDKNEAPAAPLTLPVVINGRIGVAGDVDRFVFKATKGDVWELDLRAARLGSPLDSVIVLTDEKGKELGHSDDLSGTETDSLLRFTAPADGLFNVSVADRFRSRGGPEFAYRLKIDRPAAPGFRLRLASDALTLDRGGEVKLKVDVERLGGFNEAIALEIEGLPAGVTITGNTIAAKQNSTQISFKADATAVIAPAHLKISGKALIDGAMVIQPAAIVVGRGETPPETVLLAISLPTPFKVTGVFNSSYAGRGTVFRKRYTIERNGFDGPLEVRLADKQARHLQGVTGPTIIVPAGATEFDYPTLLPPWLEIGRTSRTCIQANAVLTEPDGSKHVVSHSSVNQNEQLVVLTDPGPLSIQTEKMSFMVRPNETVQIAFRIERARHITSPVTVSLGLAEHLTGLSAEPAIVPPDRQVGLLTVRCGPSLSLINLPIVIKAQAVDQGDPVLAECKVQFVR